MVVLLSLHFHIRSNDCTLQALFAQKHCCFLTVHWGGWYNVFSRFLWYAQTDTFDVAQDIQAPGTVIHTVCTFMLQVKHWHLSVGWRLQLEAEWADRKSKWLRHTLAYTLMWICRALKQVNKSCQSVMLPDCGVNTHTHADSLTHSYDKASDHSV